MGKYSFIIDCICVVGMIISGTAFTIRRKKRPKSIYSKKTRERATEYAKNRNNMMMREQLENERMFGDFEQEYANYDFDEERINNW